MKASIRAVQNIRSCRRAKGISAQELADRINATGNWRTSRSIIANCEAGRVDHVPLDYVVAASDVLGVPVQWVVFGGLRCEICNDSPPVGFACLTCQKVRKL